jgi:hypothetical protein
MPFQDKENLSDLQTFSKEVWFNDNVEFYGEVRGLPAPFRIIKPDGSDITNVTVTSVDTISVTSESVGIVSCSKNFVTLQTTGIVQQLFENANLSSTALTGTINLDILSGTLFYYTSNASADWTFNIRGNSSTALNSILSIGKNVTVTILTTQGSTAYYANTFKIDGTTIVPKWQGGSTPSSGYTSSINIYTYSILKTADATFTILASLTKFS